MRFPAKPIIANEPQAPRALPLAFLFIDPINRRVTEALNALRMQVVAGVALGRSLRTAAPICKSYLARSAFVKAADAVDQGASFDDAMLVLAPVIAFPERAILSAGWSAGRIEPVLTAVIKRREVMYETRREFRSRMAWPCINLFAAGFILNVPSLIQGDSLFTFLVRALTPIAIAALFFLAIRFFQIWTTRRHAGYEMSAPPPPAHILDRLLLALPVFAMVQRWRNRSEFAATMSTLLGAGLGMIAALEVVSRTLPNGVYREQVIAARQRIEAEGISLAEALPRGTFWPAEWLACLDAAYIAGEEEKVLGRLGQDGRDQYLSAVRIAGRALSGLVMLGVMGYMVFLIARTFLTQIAPVYQESGL